MLSINYVPTDTKDFLELTVVYLLRGDSNNKEVLLGLKSQKIGKGLYNTAGGKIEDGETAEINGKKEMEEELGVICNKLEYSGKIDIQWPKKQFILHIFTCVDFTGEPADSEDLTGLEWFNINSLPYNKLWPADREWLEKVLKGGSIDAKLIYKDESGQNYDFNELS